MPRTLKVFLVAPSPDLVHQWQNFGEDVWRALHDECLVSLREIDALTSDFYLRGIHKRDVRTTAARVRKIAEKNKISQIIGVSEMTDDGNG